MTDPQLMKALDFDESELQANRNGRLSPKQASRLQKEERGQKGCSAVLGVFLVLVALIGLVPAFAVLQQVGPEDRTSAWIFAGAFGCFWPLVWGTIGFFVLRRAFVKMQMQVAKAEGPINIVKSIRSSYNTETHTSTEYAVYELYVGGRVLEVQASLPGAMMQGDVYAVYFAQFSPAATQSQVLSAERLSETSAAVVRDPAVADDPQVLEYLRQGQVLDAIKAHRALHKSTLEQAKGAVEEMRMRLGY